MSAGERPTLVAEPPLQPGVFPVTGSPFIIGRARESGARVDHPLVQPRHAVLLEREDGWWLSSVTQTVLVNGTPMQGRDQLLLSGDRVQLAPGATLRFDGGQPEAAKPAAVPDAAWKIAPRKRKRRWRPEWQLSTRATVLLALSCVLVASAGGVAWYARKHRAAAVPAESQMLTVTEAIVFDSLLSTTFDHVERGNILLEVGASQAALNEFAEGLSVISTSSLRNHPYVKRRLDQLRASIGEVYRARRLDVPNSLATTGRAVALGGQGLTAVLTVAQFAAAIDAMGAEFRKTFGTRLEITGRDHQEHLSLYGPGSAVDMRSKSLSPAQVQFVVSAAQRSGIRVKDFSRDAVLQAQIAAAMKAGLADRASTGLHLHLDRFANRRDRWTVQ